jgi:branched-chain amino acid aminotransferase
MSGLTVAPGVAGALATFRLPETLGFGAVSAPVMFSVEWREGGWGQGELLPYGPVEILPGARVLQYGELVFEGLKAYCVSRDWPNLFRAQDNWRRLVRSAQRLAMPEVPEALFFQGIESVAGACRDFIPPQSGRSLYLRPFLFGTETGYMLRNSHSFRFMVIANPVEIYAAGPMRVAIERDDVRATPGGVGTAKASANYAASLRASTAAAARDCGMVLWLDAQEHRYIQELSGMNLFAVIRGELHTPELDGAILPGITRDSLLALGRHRGLKMHERRIAIDELLEQVDSGECSELFACGTAAIVSPIGAFVDADGREYAPKRIDALAAELREALLAVQERRAPDPFGWTREIARPAERARA